MTIDPGHVGTIALVAQPAPAPNPDDPGGRGEDFGKASPVAFVVLIVFVIAVVLLIRSMNKHLRRVPATFDDRDERGRPVGEQPQDSTGDHGKP